MSAFAASVPWVTVSVISALSEEDEHEGTNEDVEAAQTTWQTAHMQLVLAQTVDMHYFVHDNNLPTCAKQSKMPTRGVSLLTG